MSTKIYDAYKLKGDYDLMSLNKALSDLRKQVTGQCEDLIANIVVRKFLKLYYMSLLHGTDNFTNTDKTTTAVLEKILQHDMKLAWAYLYCEIASEIADNSNIVDGDEITLLRRLLTEIYPNTSFSAVLDSYDYWNVIDNILPELKPEIMAHNGCMLMRGDSGDCVEVVTKTVFKL